MVQHVGGFGPKLEPDPLSNRESAPHRCVNVEEVRPREGIVGHIPHDAVAFSRAAGGRRRDPYGAERRRIEPELSAADSAQHMERRNLKGRLGGTGRVERFAVSREAKRPAGHERKDAAELPSARNPARPARTQPRFALAERQLINIALHEDMPAILARERVVAAERLNGSAVYGIEIEMR